MDHSRGLYRSTFCALLDDPDFQNLPPNAKLTHFCLRYSILANHAGIYVLRLAVLREHSGLSARSQQKALEQLAELPEPSKPWIYRERSVVWIRNHLRFAPGISLTNENNRKGIVRILQGLPRLRIVRDFCVYYELPLPEDFAIPEEEGGGPEGVRRGSGGGSDLLITDTDTKTEMKGSIRPTCEDCVAALCELETVTGKLYALGTNGKRELLHARHVEHGLEKCLDVIRVVGKRLATSTDPKFRRFARPKTLFGPRNFRDYLEEVEGVDNQEPAREQTADGATGFPSYGSEWRDGGRIPGRET
jgi:uncharacterized phage protein (TIGR02220 family)